MTVRAHAQSMTQVVSTTFAPGSQELFLLDLAGTRVGTFPRAIQRLSGSMSVVIQGGAPMLRATEFSEFLITLPSVLPANFTIEADLVPKDVGPEPDLTLEGTPRVNQGEASAHLLWMGDASFGTVTVIGGSTDNHEFAMPDALRQTLPRSIARVGVTVQGGTISLYTNGQHLYAVPAAFARSQVLRVTLGGVTEVGVAPRPVYLARLRVATGAPASMVTAIAPTVGGSITPVAPAPALALASRTIVLNGLTGSGGSPGVSARTIQLAGIAAKGGATGISPRTFALPQIVAAGTTAPPAGGTGSPAPRDIVLPALVGSGGASGLPARSIALPGLTAAGVVASLRARSVALPAFSATGQVKVP